MFGRVFGIFFLFLVVFSGCWIRVRVFWIFGLFVISVMRSVLVLFFWGRRRRRKRRGRGRRRMEEK